MSRKQGGARAVVMRREDIRLTGDRVLLGELLQMAQAELLRVSDGSVNALPSLKARLAHWASVAADFREQLKGGT